MSKAMKPLDILDYTDTNGLIDTHRLAIDTNLYHSKEERMKRPMSGNELNELLGEINEGLVLIESRTKYIKSVLKEINTRRLNGK